MAMVTDTSCPDCGKEAEAFLDASADEGYIKCEHCGAEIEFHKQFIDDNGRVITL